MHQAKLRQKAGQIPGKDGNGIIEVIIKTSTGIESTGIALIANIKMGIGTRKTKMEIGYHANLRKWYPSLAKKIDVKSQTVIGLGILLVALSSELE